MWVTQTYLGTVEPDADLFVYYFFGDYAEKKERFTQRVQRELERLGEVFGDQVSLLMPNPQYAGLMEAEVRENRPLWESLHGNLPALFVSRKPLAKIEPSDDSSFYIPFETNDPEKAAKIIQRVRGIANETLQWDMLKRRSLKLSRD